MADQSEQVSKISVDNLLQSIDSLIGREREKVQRNIEKVKRNIAEMESKIDSSFDELRDNLINHVYDSIAIEADTDTPSTMESTNADTTTSLPPSLPIEPTDHPLPPPLYLERYPVLIKKFDTIQGADEYRLADNFRYPKRRDLKDGLLVKYNCYIFFNCPARLIIWKSKANQRFLVFSNGKPHSHDRAASESQIDPETRREIECLFNQGVRTPREVFELLCAKHGEKAVNGFTIIRCLKALRVQEGRK